MSDWETLPAIARQRQAELCREAAAYRLVGGGWLARRTTYRSARRKRRAAAGPVRVSGWLLRLTDAELVVLGAELENVIAAHRRACDDEPGATPITVRLDAHRG